MYSRLSSLLRASEQPQTGQSAVQNQQRPVRGTDFTLVSETNKLDLRYKSQTHDLFDPLEACVIRGFKPAIVLLILLATFAVAIADRLGRPSVVNFGTAGAPDAASLFNSQCAQCHGRDGRAKTKRGRQTHTRDITGAEWQNDVSDERIFNSISRGKGKMPAFKKLSDAQIDSLVSYVRRLRK